MIEFDVITYLKADTTLDTLLSSSASDSKIYPAQAPLGAQDKIPYIVYTINQSGSYEENLKEESITFDCISNTYLQSKNIKDRLATLLDIQDSAYSAIDSDYYYIYWAKFTAGNSYVDGENNLYHNILVVNFKFNKVS